MIDSNLLRYVVVAADTGSFSQAADRFGIKQTTLSKSIHYLEDRLGLALFQRSTRGVKPTDPGQRFLQRARHILDDFDRLLTDTRSLAAGDTGVLRFGFHTSLASGDLSASLTAFRGTYRDVEIEAFELNRDALLSAVQRGQLDLAITVGRASADGLRSQCLWTEHLVAALPGDHSLAIREQLYWTDLKGERFVVSADDPGPDIQAIIRNRLSSPGYAPDVRVQRVGRDNLLQFAQGDSIAIGTGFMARRSPNAPVLHEIHDAFGATAIEQRLVWRSDSSSAPLRLFLAMMAERYGREIDA